MANLTFPANSWASGLTLIDASQQLYQDSEGYYYTNSNDGKTLFDLGANTHIDYDGNPVGSSTSTKTNFIDLLKSAVQSYFNPPSAVKTPTPVITKTVTPSGVPATATPSVMPYILGGLVAVGAVAAFMYYKKKK